MTIRSTSTSLAIIIAATIGSSAQTQAQDTTVNRAMLGMF